MRVTHSGQHEYDLDGVKLQEAHQEKDLGVEVSSTLKPSLQCTKAAAKAMQVLGIIKRNFVTQNKEDFRLLFDGYVRPHLEYCVQVWSPYLKDIECLEKVQRRATKLVKGLKHKPYAERLARLHTMSLEKRKTRGDLIQVFRILKGFDSVDTDHFFFELEDGGGYRLRGHRLKLKVQRCQLQVRQNFFSVRIVNLWNKLPESVVECSSVNVFKKRLDDWIADVNF